MGVKSGNLPTVSLAVELLVNGPDGTGRQSVSDLAVQMSSSGPLRRYEDEAAFFGDATSHAVGTQLSSQKGAAWLVMPVGSSEYDLLHPLSGQRLQVISVDGSVLISSCGRCGHGDPAADMAAYAVAAKVCRRTRADLIWVPPAAGRYYFTAPLVLYQRHFSQRARGRVIIDLSGCADGVWGIQLYKAGPGGNIGAGYWDIQVNTIEGLHFEGRSLVNGVDLDGGTEAQNFWGQTRTMWERCFFNNFGSHLRLGNNRWTEVFDKCAFRAAAVAYIVSDKTWNGSENVSFNACVFYSGDGVVWHHVQGAIEAHFNMCSFDYCAGGIFRHATEPSGNVFGIFDKCHFEDHATATQFIVESSASAFSPYIQLVGCDWDFIETRPQHIAQWPSSRGKLTVERGVFKMAYDEVQADAELFQFANASTTQVAARDNVVQTATADKFISFSRRLNLYPAFTAGNLANPDFFILSEPGAPQVVSLQTTGLPAEAKGFGFRKTGGAGWSVRLPFDPHRPLRISGWFFRSTDAYLPQLRWYTYAGDVIDPPIGFAGSGALNTWVRFGQQGLIAPPGAVWFVMQISQNGAQTASDYAVGCDWLAEQI